MWRLLEIRSKLLNKKNLIRKELGFFIQTLDTDTP